MKTLVAFVGLALGVGTGCNHLMRERRADRADIARLPAYTVRDLGPSLTAFPIQPDFGLNNNGQVLLSRRKDDGNYTTVFFDPANPSTLQEWSLPLATSTVGGGGHKSGTFAVTATINRPTLGGLRTQGGPFRGSSADFLTPVPGFDDCRAVDRTEDRIFVGDSSRREATEIVRTASMWWGVNKTDIGAEMAAQGFGASSSFAMQINNQNTVVGYFFTGEANIGQRRKRAWVRFGNGTLRQDLAQTLAERVAFSINDANIVAGGGSAAWVWSPLEGATVLLPGATAAGGSSLATQGAHSINSNGLVVGAASMGNMNGVSACFWRPTSYRPQQGVLAYAAPTDLNQLAAVPEGFHLFSAVRINDSGQILCYGLKGAEQRAFLLTPRFSIR